MYQGKLVNLRALEQSDLVDTHRFVNDYETMRGAMSGMLYPSSHEDEARWASGQSSFTHGEYQFAIETIESGAGLPFFLRPSYLGERVDPNLSAAWMVDGKPVAFVAGFQTGDRVFCMSSIWRGPDAPPSSFRSLILTQINQCWYRSGGSFSFFISPITPRVEAIAEWFTGGNYDPYTHRDAEIPIPSDP